MNNTIFYLIGHPDLPRRAVANATSHLADNALFTEAMDGVHARLPQLRDPDNLVYFREEVGGLCMGGYERNPAPWSLDGIPPDFNGKLLAPDMPRFEEIMAGAVRLIAPTGMTTSRVVIESPAD